MSGPKDNLSPSDTAKFIDEKVKYCSESRDALSRTFVALAEKDRVAAQKLAASLLNEWGVKERLGPNFIQYEALTAFTQRCIVSPKTDEEAARRVGRKH